MCVCIFFYLELLINLFFRVMLCIWGFTCHGWVQKALPWRGFLLFPLRPPPQKKKRKAFLSLQYLILFPPSKSLPHIAEYDHRHRNHLHMPHIIITEKIFVGRDVGQNMQFIFCNLLILINLCNFWNFRSRVSIFWILGLV